MENKIICALSKIHLYTIFKDIIHCFMISCGEAFLIIFFYWDELTSSIRTRSVFVELVKIIFIVSVFMIIILRIFTRDKRWFGKYETAYETIPFGIAQTKEKVASEYNRKVYAVHEAGHALMAYLREVDNFHITLSKTIAKTIAIYNTQNAEDVKTMILIDYSGAVAEEILLGSFSLCSMGPTDSDFVKATEHIKNYIIMTDSSVSKTMLNEELSQQVINLSKKMYSMAMELLYENKELLKVLSNELMEKEEMSKEEIIELIRH